MENNTSLTCDNCLGTTGTVITTNPPTITTAEYRPMQIPPVSNKTDEPIPISGYSFESLVDGLLSVLASKHVSTSTKVIAEDALVNLIMQTEKSILHGKIRNH